MLNRAFFAGLQWVLYTGGRIARPTIDRRRNLVTDNRITPIITGRIAKKTKTKPTFSAQPQTADDRAINAARIAERVLENDWAHLKLQPTVTTALIWADVCADGFVKTFWDKTKGDKIGDFLFVGGQPLTNPQDGTPLPADAIDLVPPEDLDAVEVRPVFTGDVCCEVKSPFEIYPDPLATSMDDLEWLIDETVRSVEWVKARYPYDAQGQPFEPHTDAEVPYGLTEGWVGIGQLYRGSTAGSQGVKVREYWCRPNTEHPNGWYAVWINDTVVLAEEPFDPMPYDKFASGEVPGRFWSQSVTTNMRPQQIDLNILRTQILENARRIGNPALMKSRQANVRYEGIPGEVIEYDSTISDAVPSYLVPPPIPVYLENEIARVEKSLEETSGMHDVSRASVPAGVTAASAINLLQEADESLIAPEIRQMEHTLGRIGTKILRLRARFNTDERLLRIAGEDGAWDIQGYKGEMLGPDPNVEVQAGSAMPRSKAAKQAAMTEVLGLLLQYGVPIEERNLRKYLKDYEVGGLERIFEGFSEDAKQVNRENRQLMNGVPVRINAFDNHQFHIDEHTDFQKTSTYANLPAQIQEGYEAHVNLHRQHQVGIVDQQMAQQSEEVQQDQDEQLRLEAAQVELEGGQKEQEILTQGMVDKELEQIKSRKGE